MKIANYYRTEENKFCRLIHLDETELEPYEKIYVFSESTAYNEVPEHFKRASNIIYGGTAFTNDVYVPFDNSIIDYTLPHTFIYKEWLKEKNIAGLPIKETLELLDSTYYRYHAGTEILPLPVVHRRKKVYIYDNNLFQTDWRPIIEKILARGPSSINLIHPAKYNKISDFLEVYEHKLIARTTDTYLNLNIPLKETPILMKHYKTRLLATITKSSQIFLSLGGSFYYGTEYLKDLIYKLNLLYIFWSNGIPIKIQYEKPKIGCYNPYANISKLIATWTQGDTKHTKTILERIPKDKSLSDRRPEREQIEAIIKRFPSADTLFRQTTETVKKGGTWKYGHG